MICRKQLHADYKMCDLLPGAMIHLILSGFLLSDSGILAQVTLPNQPIKDALFLHNTSISNSTLRDCIFRPINRRDLCPDPLVHLILYNSNGREVVNYAKTDWLRQSIWNHTNENILLIHGYAGGDQVLPLIVLKDAYVKTGQYNVWLLDWGGLAFAPCYRAAVHNLKAVAHCTGDLLMNLRLQGLPADSISCVGHSLGAHLCGLISRNVYFRMHRIVALDPARPLIPSQLRLSPGDALAVQVLHTNAGHYGEAGKGGHVDFCINGGKIQPFCVDSGLDDQLCSHIWAVCFMAESLDPNRVRLAEACSRRCPTGPRPGHRIGIPIKMGQYTPLSATGSYCVQSKVPANCPEYIGAPGDSRCCLVPPVIKNTSTHNNNNNN